MTQKARTKRRRGLSHLLWRGGLVLLLILPLSVRALDISDCYSKRNRSRPARKSTQFIILHTTEGKEQGSLQKVRDNGEAHYFVTQKGHVYRVVEKHRVAYHAGVSMWNGIRSIDNHAIGIEVSGYHDKDISAAQYQALKELVSQVQRIYNVPDERVLTHSMVAYGRPNRWHKKSHRGRKRCGMLFALKAVRRKLGLTSEPQYDPDVRAGRLVEADAYLASILYGTPESQEKALAWYSSDGAKIIGKNRTAWDIAGEDYASAKVTYIFPDGTEILGDAVKDWTRIPVGTRVVAQ